MPELRVTLLVLGLVFLIGLAWWEMRRSHQARGSDLPRPSPEPVERGSDRAADWGLPPLELPRINARNPEADLPVVEVDPDKFAALSASAAPASHISVPEPADAQDEDEPADIAEREFMEVFLAAEPATANDADAPEAATLVEAPAPIEEQVPIETPAPLEGTAPIEAPETISIPETVEIPASVAVAEPDFGGMDGLLAEVGSDQAVDPPISDITESFRNGVLSDDLFTVESVTVRTYDAPVVSPAAASEPAPEERPQTHPAAAVAVPTAIAATPSAPGADPAQVVVEWPAAEASQVLAVRLVSASEKLSGRAVRMALSAEGFVLGKFSIFHKPAADGRALLSIASLNKPGTFDLHSIDLQRFTGLNLFAVLPGPLPGPETVEELLSCAQVLGQRLRATLQDEGGQPLTASRTALMRSTAAAAST